MRTSTFLSVAIAVTFAMVSATAQAAPKAYWDAAKRKYVQYENGRIVGAPSRGRIKRQDIVYDGPYGPNTIIVNTSERRLYYVYEKGKALKYGIGVGREGFEWSGTHRITRKAEWPGWTPPPEMIERERAKGRILPAFMEGGIGNPLGARALYIGSTLYRIHGTAEPWTIGRAVSSGCIRLTNDDIVDLYDRVKVGAKVVVLAE
jgi:lipoprotein-anchoring transpeptidase ErfK/SrfK